MSNIADNRSVATDALAVLGTIFKKGTVGRDAVHIAVEPVTAGERLHPAEDISVENGIAFASKGKMIGIVDPFLNDYVEPGQEFLLVVYPRQITSLRHVWSHPDFPEPSEPMRVMDRQQAVQWLRSYCSENDCPDYETMVDYIKSGDSDSDRIYTGDHDFGGTLTDEFWDYMETALGHRITSRPAYFSCAC